MFNDRLISNALVPVLKPRLHRLMRRAKPYAMVSRKRMQNLHRLLWRVRRDGVAGDVVEAGVARGGSAILLAGLVQDWWRDRHVWLYDAFEAISRPTASHDQVSRTLFERFRFDRQRVHLTAGLFEEVIDQCPARRIALLHIDAGRGDGVRACLEALYQRVTPGGWIVLDNYGEKGGCRRVVNRYLRNVNIRPRTLQRVGSEAFFQKPAQ